ncbi:MAG TPA: glycine zipper 2TM domain-containing protein [Paucimonas sp.]|nr:glycine zipper 2TM domain-containing protein [Paucimonas sp.]
MNKLKKTGFLILLAGIASAASAAEFDEYARVVSVTPQVERFNVPRQECRTEYVQVQQPQQRSTGGAIVGGIIGGLAGNQVGKGDGRAVATAAGAIAGAIIGDRVDNSNTPTATVAEQPVRQCRMVEQWESRTTGYLVTYEYRGHTYTSNMAYDPGERVKLHVTLTPR